MVISRTATIYFGQWILLGTLAQTHIAVIVRSGGLYQSHINRHEFAVEQPRDLGQEYRRIICESLVNRISGIISTGEGVMPKVLGEFFIRVRSNTESPYVEYFGVEKGPRMRLDVAYESTNKILGFTAACADKYPLASTDMTEYLLLRNGRFRIFPLHLIEYSPHGAMVAKGDNVYKIAYSNPFILYDPLCDMEVPLDSYRIFPFNSPRQR